MSSPTDSPSIPKLPLHTCETGGGWGLGDQFARLPPAAEQTKHHLPVYKVAEEKEVPKKEKDGGSVSISGRRSSSYNHGSDSTTSSYNNSSDKGRSHRNSRSESSNDRSLSSSEYPAAVSASSSPPNNHNNTYTNEQNDFPYDDDDEYSDDSGNRTFRDYSRQREGEATAMKQNQSIKSPIPESEYYAMPDDDDDDNTFVDHGSASPQSGPLLSKSQLQSSNTPSHNDRSVSNGGAQNSFMLDMPSKSESLMGSRQKWQPPRLVSRMSMNQNVRDMVMSPDGKTLWAAIGDDPLAAFELDGTDLCVTRAMDSVTQVYCMTLVKLPKTKQISFKSTALEKARRARKRTNTTGAGNGSRTPGKGTDEEEEDSGDRYALWCGVNKGHINIIDLQAGVEDGFIRSAHSQTVNRMWYLENGTVWTAGRDKAIRVWDPQTRRKVKNRNIAAILSDMCFVQPLNAVWAIADDNIIRVFEAGGDNVRVAKQSHDKAENAIKMKSDISLIQYDAGANLVWVGMPKITAIMSPSTYEAVTNLQLTLSSVVFHQRVAIITGYGAMLGVEGTSSRIALLDVTSPLEPSLLFLGGSIFDAINPIGIRLFTSVPLAVVAHDEGRLKHKKLSVFTYEEVEPFGRMAHIPDSPARSTRKRSGESRHSKQGGYEGVSSKAPAVTTENVTGGSALPSPGSAALPLAGQRSGGGVALLHSSELLSSINQLDRRTDELTNALANIRRTELPMSDFAKIHSALTQWMLSSPDDLLPLDPAEQEIVERDFQTAEGKAVGVAVARLRKTASASVLPPHANVKESVSRSPPQSMLATRAPVESGDSNEHREASMGASDYYVGGPSHPFSLSESNCMLDPFSTTLHQGGSGGMPGSEATMQWLAQITRITQEERHSHQRQMQRLQKHNKRYVERNTAFVNGFTRLEQTLSTHGQHLLDEVSLRLAALTGGNENSHTPTDPPPSGLRLQVNQLQEALHSIPSLSTNSSPREISDTLQHYVDVLSRIVSMQQAITALAVTLPSAIRRDSYFSERSAHSDANRMFSPKSEAVPSTDYTSGLTTSAPLPLTGEVSAVDSMYTGSVSHPHRNSIGSLDHSDAATSVPFDTMQQRSQQEGESSIATMALSAAAESPKTVTEGSKVSQVAAPRLLEMVTDEVLQSERHILELKTAWNNIEGMRKVIYLPYADRQRPDLGKDFMQFVVLWDLVQVQNLMDLGREECNFNMMEVVLEKNKENGCFGGQFRFAAVYKSSAEKAKVQEEASKELSRVVNLSVELETCTARHRRTFARQQSSLPSDIRANPYVRGLAAMNPPPFTNERKLQGLLYWCHVCLHLICEGFECVEELIFPQEEGATYLNKDNFLLMENRLEEWSGNVREILRLAQQIRSGLLFLRRRATASQKAQSGANNSSNSNNNNNNNTKEVSSPSVILRTSMNASRDQSNHSTSEDGEVGESEESDYFLRFDGNGLRPIVFSIYAQYIAATNTFPNIFDTSKSQQRTLSPTLLGTAAGDGESGRTLVDSLPLLNEAIAQTDQIEEKCTVLKTFYEHLQRRFQSIVVAQRRMSEEDDKNDDVFVSINNSSSPNATSGELEESENPHLGAVGGGGGGGAASTQNEEDNKRILSLFYQRPSLSPHRNSTSTSTTTAVAPVKGSNYHRLQNHSGVLMDHHLKELCKLKTPSDTAPLPAPTPSELTNLRSPSLSTVPSPVASSPAAAAARRGTSDRTKPQLDLFNTNRRESGTR